MKLSQKSLFASLALGTALVVSGTSVAQAAVTITIAPSGADVVAGGNGTINLSALSLLGPSASVPFVRGENGSALLGGGNLNIYAGFAGPANFGSGIAFLADTGSGNAFGIIAGANFLLLPSGYVSNAPLSGTATWNIKTISGLGLTPGTYVYNWGTGPTADSLTVQIVPEPSHALLLLGGLGTLALRRRR